MSALLDIRFGTVEPEFGTASGWQQMAGYNIAEEQLGGGLDFRYLPETVLQESNHPPALPGDGYFENHERDFGA